MPKTLSLLLAGLSLAACAPPPRPVSTSLAPAANPSALLALLASTSTPDASRQAADARLVAQGGKALPGRLAVLEQMLYAPGHSDAMRTYALDQLAAAEPARAANALTLYLPRMEGDVLAHACTVAVALGDPRLVDPLIRSLDRGPGNPRERPEIAALQTLSGKTADEALFDAFTTAESTSTRIAALDILERLEPADALMKRIAALASPTGMAAAVQWWAAGFGTLPRGANEAEWVVRLDRPENAALVARALERHKLLVGQSDYLAAPRFVHTLAFIDEGSVRMTRQQLLADLQQTLAALPHAHRPPSHPHAPDDLADTLEANADKLSRGDLLMLRLLLRTLPPLLPTLYQQGLDDLSDTTTEHGGLLAWTGGGAPALSATLYRPTYPENDLTYITPDALVRDTVLGAAQYHFHFQQIHNTDRAGPGQGDLAYIRTAACNAVVITSIDTRKINLDFYTPAGAVIDLGTYTLQ